MENKKIIVKLNPDSDKVNKIKEALKITNGYCPCEVIQTEDTKCMCKDFRDFYTSGKTGPCHCGRFVAVEE